MTAILGGGLSGLSAAYYLLRAQARPVTLFECSKTVGGWIQSEKQENGLIFEQGPRTIRPRGIPGANTLSLIEDLKLTEEVRPILSSHPAATNRLIYVNNELHKLPAGLIDIFKKKSPFSKPLISFILSDLKASAVAKTDESCYDFIHRRFGREIADYMISALLCGICAGDAKEISVKFLMKHFFELEQKYGSIIKGVIIETLSNWGKGNTMNCNLAKRAKNEKWSVYSLKDGLAVLPNQLKKNISSNENFQLQMNAPCSNITFSEKAVKLTINEKEFSFDHLISSVSSLNLAQLLKNQHPILAEELSKIPFVNVIVINLAFDKNVMQDQAFGFLVPPSQKLPILGVIFDSCCFDVKDKTALTVMMGGRWFDNYFGPKPNEDELLHIALDHLKQLLKIKEKPSLYKVSILQNCIAQYIVGHEDRLKKINDYINGNKLPISLIGASYHGVGINDVILSAKKGVENLVNVK